MFRSFRRWLRDVVLTDEDDIRYIESVRISRGKTLEERLTFWQNLATWFATDEGKAFQALMQREYVRLESIILTENDATARNEAVQRLRQQNYVISFPQHVEDMIAKTRAKLPR